MFTFVLLYLCVTSVYLYVCTHTWPIKLISTLAEQCVRLEGEDRKIQFPVDISCKKRRPVN